MRNTSRAWAYETGIAAGVELGPGNFHYIQNTLNPDQPFKTSLSTSIMNILGPTTSLMSNHPIRMI
jgi:hypothetical protein